MYLNVKKEKKECYRVETKEDFDFVITQELIKSIKFAKNQIQSNLNSIAKVSSYNQVVNYIILHNENSEDCSYYNEYNKCFDSAHEILTKHKPYELKDYYCWFFTTTVKLLKEKYNSINTDIHTVANDDFWNNEDKMICCIGLIPSSVLMTFAGKGIEGHRNLSFADGLKELAEAQSKNETLYLINDKHEFYFDEFNFLGNITTSSIHEKYFVMDLKNRNQFLDNLLKIKLDLSCYTDIVLLPFCNSKENNYD